MEKIVNSTILIQTRYRYLNNRIKFINQQLDFLYQLFNSIIHNLQYLYLQNVITQITYNSSMYSIDNIFNQYKKLPRPILLCDLKDIKLYQLKDIIKKLSTDLYNFTKKQGCINIKEIMTLNTLYNNHFTLIDYTKYINMSIFYEKKFVIISYYISKISQYNTETQLIVYNDEKEKFNKSFLNDSKVIKDLNKPICTETNRTKKSIIEEINGAKLYYPVNTEDTIYYIIAEGFFIYDTLNICRVGGYFEKKNKQLELAINGININTHFKLGYIQQLSQKDFVIYDIQNIINMCIDTYNEYKKLRDLPISSLIKKFLNAKLKRKRDILTLFLLIDDINSKYLAFLLYDMITNDNYLFKEKTASEMLFNSLHWSIQKLLKIAIKRVNVYTQNLVNFKEDEISYEKRICLLKAPDNVKKKAMSKYKEVSKNNDNSFKATQYLDGLLKIPFGIFRKEHIIAFLPEFIIKIKNNISNNIKLLNPIIGKTEDNKLDNIINIVNEFDNIENIISNDIDVFLKTIKDKIDITLQTKVSNDIDKSYFNKAYIKKICKQLKKKELLKIISDINISENNLNTFISLKGKKQDIVEKISVFLSKYENQHYIKKYSSGLGVDNKTTIIQKYKISKNNKYKRFCKQIYHFSNEWQNYKTNYKKYLKNVKQCLDDAVYGQNEAKNQIEQIIAQWINGEMKGYCFGFEGPPGTGKTSLAKNGIAKCLIDDNGDSRPFSFIALGGTSNGSTLEGHNYTYVGSTWGRIVDILMDVKCMNPIIFIDELDKVSKTDHGKEIIGILTHLTDTTQNCQFNDKYFSGIDLDLSRVLFIFSYNDYSLLDPILADRIHRVKFKRLSKKDKFKIARDYILPELLSIVGFNKGTIIFPDEVLEYIINNYTYEAGARKLKEKLFEIIRNINLKYLQGEFDNIDLPFEITTELINDIFRDKNKIIIKKILNTPKVGHVNGLYATSSGLGGLTIIEAFKTPSESKLSLELTGQQGDVMKESMKVAKTVAWNLLPDNIKKNIWSDMKDNSPFGIHIHCPEGAVPKDGPSAGIAITLAIISLLCNIPIKNTIALTGEIDLDGSIHQIGGLDIKIDGAKQANVKIVICPEQNKVDVDNIILKDTTFLDNIEIVYIKTIWDVLELAFINNDIIFNNYSV
tara:strand:- start:2540 stop:5974 length:3435 start_codon:yes stop_codon:yes gene_type:complete